MKNSAILDRLQDLINETERWREQHRANRNQIDAAACAVRLNALKEAHEILRKLLDETA